jgi:hypothetical protein
MLLAAVQQLASAGAELALVAPISAHIAFDDVRAASRGKPGHVAMARRVTLAWDRESEEPMSVARLDEIPGFNIDRVAAAAGDDPDVLRLENLDTDIPPAQAIEATRAAIGEDEAFCLTDPGDEVVLTDPTHAGMLNRVRLVGAVPRLVPLHVAEGEWRLDLEALPAAVTERTRVVFINNASFPSGWVANDEEWDAIARICCERDLRLLYWAATKASSSTAGRSGIPPRSRECAIEPSPSAPQPWSSG